MPFDASCRNPRLVDQVFLFVYYKGHELSFNLNNCLANVNGKFQWGKTTAFNNSKDYVLDGSKLTAQLENGKDEYHRDQIDLSDRIRVVNGKLTFSKDPSTKHFTYHNPRLVVVKKSALCVTYKGDELSLNLNDYLGNVDGRFTWGKTGVFNSTLHQALDESTLTAMLKNANGQYLEDRIDLSDRIRVVDGRLTSLGISSREPTPPPYPGHTGSGLELSESKTSLTRTFSESFRAFKTREWESQSTTYTYTEQASVYFRFSVEELSIKGTVLVARCRQPDGSAPKTSEIDLKDYIGVIAGRLVWGGHGFIQSCEPGSIKIVDRHILHVKCYDSSRTKWIVSTLDLSRYLHVFRGFLEAKLVGVTNHEISLLLNEARWMQFKVITEPQPEAALDISAFRQSFKSVAALAFEHVVQEVKEEYKESSNTFIREVLTQSVQEQLATTIREVIKKKIQMEITETVDRIFSESRREVINTCLQIAETAAAEVTTQYSRSILTTMEKEISQRCNTHILNSLEAVSTSAIAQFQSSAEILMEQELLRASLHAARGQASFLKLMAAKVEESAGIRNGSANGILSSVV